MNFVALTQKTQAVAGGRSLGSCRIGEDDPSRRPPPEPSAQEPFLEEQAVYNSKREMVRQFGCTLFGSL